MNFVKFNDYIELYCGDCQNILPNISFNSIVTDPPYGMQFKSNHRKIKHKAIENDDSDDFLQYICNIKASHSKYIFGRWNNLKNIPLPKSVITWVKNNWSMGDLKHEHARQTELVFFYQGDNHFFPLKRPKDVVMHPRTQNKFHPTEKPIPLMEEILGWTDGVVVDPFMGSGSTAIAAIKQKKKFVGIELNRTYFDIACERIEAKLKENGNG